MPMATPFSPPSSGCSTRRSRTTEADGRAMNRLDGKIALLSGAARGIGAETARLMVEAGAAVAIGDVLDERGRDTARALEEAGGKVFYLHLDVTRESDWAAAVEAVAHRFGGLDILVNNAGVFVPKAIEET